MKEDLQEDITMDHRKLKEIDLLVTMIEEEELYLLVKDNLMIVDMSEMRCIETTLLANEMSKIINYFVNL